MSKIFYGIAIGLFAAVAALVLVAESHPGELLNSDTVAILAGGLITAAAVIGFGLLLLQGGWVPFLQKEEKRVGTPRRWGS